ncbi:glycosyl hydrolase family 28-related protein [Labilibaculum antarcticum]|uniref:Rhamnogalacturonase A/B/Epimerase-like pectate lyase domain-containing protein n=1 Tax=Labilibaculum antarcticum TaxID=1717717 RepID=A0A1Y1CM52_9BACT|nr:glycosyl hydrolase family 28-related protein [Labilibaculum antarcticum]BAX81103.1 hypothetical protein ALGA_2791 [Labilibaculum antarcticum]
MRKLVVQIILIAVIFNVNQVFAQKESRFYTETNQLGIVKNLVDDYVAKGNDKKDDSKKLQRAINELSAMKNGGRIIVPAGTYYFSMINLKSNVHIEIENDVIIHPAPRTDNKNYAVFLMGDNKTIVKNVSVRGLGGNFTVDLRNLKNKNVTVFRLNNSDNFLLANFDVKDEMTKFSSIAFGYTDYKGGYTKSRNGVVKNASTDNSHYGYGLVQAQAGHNILFKNLSGEGGVTLRLETGNNKMNKLQVGGISDIFAKNIACENGNSAVMISPHGIQNGHVEVDGVKSVNCGFAVRIGNGYVKKDQIKLGVKPGSYASTSKVQNVTATFGETAQVKSKHFKYMPVDLRKKIQKTDDPKVHIAPSIAAVVNDAAGEGKGKYKIEVKNVKAIGFTSQPKVVITGEDAIK